MNVFILAVLVVLGISASLQQSQNSKMAARFHDHTSFSSLRNQQQSPSNYFEYMQSPTCTPKKNENVALFLRHAAKYEKQKTVSFISPL